MAKAKKKSRSGTSFTNAERAARGRPSIYSFTLPPKTAKQLETLAASDGVSKSEVVVRAVALYAQTDDEHAR